MTVHNYVSSQNLQGIPSPLGYWCMFIPHVLVLLNTGQEGGKVQLCTFLSIMQLLQRDPTERLGCIESREPIRHHPFFKEIDFVKLEARKLKPPFKPNVVRLCTVFELPGIKINY